MPPLTWADHYRPPQYDRRGNIQVQRLWNGQFDTNPELLNQYQYFYDRNYRMGAAAFDGFSPAFQHNGIDFLDADIDSALTWKTAEQIDLKEVVGPPCYAVIEPSNKYDAWYRYDKIGNITRLKRKQLHPNSGVWALNQMEYSYAPGMASSRLEKVAGPAALYATKYTYDANGNMASDDAPGIQAVTYDWRNRPTQMNTGSASYTYRYDAAGMRSHRLIQPASGPARTEFFLPGMVLDATGAILRLDIADGFAEITPNGTMDRHHILRDWLDTPRMTLDASGAVAQAGDYYPYGRAMDQRSHTAIPEADRYRFTGHEHDAESGYDYHGARYYQAEVGRYLGVDVMAVEMPEWSSFRYGLDNPIMYIDPTGKSETTFVEQNEDGTYKVVNGVDDGNNSIVLIRDNKFVAVIGFSATPESFYFSGNEGEAGSWQGTIDPNDQSGRNFLNTEILQKNPLLFYYMPNATGGKYYDFKVTNGSNQKIETLEGHYRGMPILGEKNGLPIFASARDIGNIAAGLVAGRHGMDWTIARLGFDALESWQKGELATEASGTQYAQKLGWRIGRDILEKSELSRLPGNGHLRNIEISSDLIYKGDL